MATTVLRKILRSHLFRNAVFYGGIFALSEVTQETIMNFEEYDGARIGRIAFYGFSCHGPANYAWLNFIERQVPGLSLRRIAVKVVIGQFTINPVIVSMFYVVTNALEGKPDILAELKEKFWRTYFFGLCFWPPFMFLAFRVFPHHYRAAAIGVAGLLWGNFLCFMKTLNTPIEQESKSLENRQMTQE
ncbi:mpv17-like protein [Glandiceps talaboti]